jgi:cell fate regulator YaaT (PSP1 superfamily)
MLIEVCFQGNRKEFFLWEGEEPPALKSSVVVEADRGEDVGHVHSVAELAESRARQCAHGPAGEAITLTARRLATTEEVARLRELREQDESARRKAAERVRANGLIMKLTDAEWRWDRRKLTLYFTAEKRVDFRNLVRELAAMFRTRIELKQIGVRDEAKRLSGIGRCGREYCSASWLPELRPVNLGVAKDQRLSLNPSQISGACGRLMCCLRYEHDFYVQQRKRFPKEGKLVTTSHGQEKVLANDIFRERVTLRSSEGETRILALEELRREMGGERPPETAEDEMVAPNLEEISDEVIRLQDTVELPAWVPRAGPSTPPGPRSRTLPIAQPDVVERPVAASAPAPDESDADDDPGDTGDASSAASPERRRRRRGRRGGRRNRDARNRHEQDKDQGDNAGGAGEPGRDPN